MMDYNRATVIGQLVGDPTSRTTAAGKVVVSFRVRARRRRHTRESMTIRAVVFGLAAEVFMSCKRDGDYVFASGRLCQAVFPGKEGGTIEHHYLVAEDFRFLPNPAGRVTKGGRYAIVLRTELERLQELEASVGRHAHVAKALRGDIDQAEMTDAELDAAVQSVFEGFDPVAAEGEGYSDEIGLEDT